MRRSTPTLKVSKSDELIFKIAEQSAICDARRKEEQDLWQTVLRKQRELKEAEDRYWSAQKKTVIESDRLTKLEDKTPRGQVLKQKFLLNTSIEYLEKKIRELREVDGSSAPNKEFKLKLQVDRAKERVENYFNGSVHAANTHGNHGDRFEWIFRNYPNYFKRVPTHLRSMND